MSTTARSSQRGGTKNSKQQKGAEENHKTTEHSNKNSADKENKSHKNDAGSKSIKNNSTGDKKGSAKAPPQPTAEQLRMARLIKSEHEDPAPDLQAKIKQVMDLTRKSEEAVCAALAENDEDVNRAVEVLLESDEAEFEFTSVKKKKSKTVPNSKEAKDKAGPEEELNHVTSANGGGGFERRGRGRGRGGATSDRGGRPFRSRENKENESYRGPNSNYTGAGGPDEFSGGDRPRRGGPRMTNGPAGGPGRYGGARGGRGGGRGGSVGPRTYSSRQQDRDSFPKSIDTWNNPPGAEDSGSTPVKMETWGEFPSPEDWDNEEYTGSLADSKVFTPSSAPESNLPQSGLEDGSAALGDTLNGSFNSNTGEPPATGSAESPGTSPLANTSADDITSPVSLSGTLTAAQSQYLSQLTQQAQSGQLTSQVASGQQGHYAAVSNPSAPAYTTGTEFVNSYSTTLNDIGNTQQVLPQRNKAPRTRLPPPSKIPASAVEMPPGDTSSGAALGSIDVQFGALDFGSEPSSAAQVSFGVDTQPDSSATGSGVQSLPPAAVKYSSQATDPIAEHAYVSSTSLAAAASQLKNNHTLTSSLGKGSGADSILNDSSYSAGRNTTFQELASMASKAVQDPYESSSFPAASQSLYQSGKTSSSVSSSYPPSSTPYPPSHSQPSYSTSSTGYSSSTGYNQMSNGSHYSTNPSSQYSNSSSYVPSGYPGGYSTPSYQQPGSNSGSYGSSGQQSSAAYQYNNVSGLGNSGYNSYQSSGAGGALAHKLGSAASAALSKDSQYESIPAGGQSGTPATLNSSTPAGLSSLTQSSISSSNSSSGGQKSSGTVSGVNSSSNPPSSAKSSNVASIPPGVGAPVVGTQYIMSSTGLPYMYNQPPMYNFEDLQLVQNRIPHGYYDLGFPPTSMGGREGASIPAYSAMSDARFARTDNNASPVPSSLSTQNATQAPLLNPPLPYAYYYSSIPSNPFSYSTPLYPQVNAGGYASTQPGGTAGGTGVGKSSGGGVSNVTGGVANASPQGTGGASAGNPQADLMYSAAKSQHASLAKVNSYDKATFHHTGTPPPYSLPGVGSVGVGGALGPSGTFAAPGHSAYAPVIVPGPQAPHHSTPLMHQPHMQMDLRTSQTRRTDSTGNSTSRSQAGSQVNKTSSKPYYGNWTQN